MGNVQRNGIVLCRRALTTHLHEHFRIVWRPHVQIIVEIGEDFFSVRSLFQNMLRPGRQFLARVIMPWSVGKSMKAEVNEIRRDREI